MNTAQVPLSGPSKRLTVELLALDLDRCSRCTGAAANLRAAMAVTVDLFREAGTEMVYRETIVGTAAEAELLRFAASPTVRINGRDIAVEFRESSCADCGELCGCGGGVNCRVWVWQGREYTEAPRALFLDALLSAYSQSGHSTDFERIPFRLPENLCTFYAARKTPKEPESACCDESACCEPAEKSVCCGNKNANGEIAAGSACGCQ